MDVKRNYNQQPNIITNSTEELSLLEKRMVYLVINQIKTEKGITQDLFQNEEYIIETSKIGQTNTNDIREACQKLVKRSYTVIEDYKNGIFKYMTPFPSVTFNKGSGTIKIILFSEAVPKFREIKNGYTRYELTAALTLSSIYSQKLYELLSRWKDKKEWEVDVIELLTLMSATHYDYPGFNQRGLKPAIAEINKKTNLFVSVNILEKLGKKVMRLKFSIIDKNTDANAENKFAIAEEKEQFSKLSPGEVAHFVDRFLNAYTFNAIQRKLITSDSVLLEKFADLDRKITHGEITPIKPTNYIAKCLGFTKK